MKTTDRLPQTIESGVWPYGHCQGIAADLENEVMYFSFTTALVKTDLHGNLIGSVTGLLGHLGCIAFHKADGRVYGSLEYKDDEIGQGIPTPPGTRERPNTAFYIAVFDAERITHPDMDACADSIMQTVYLREVFRDYSAPGHRYGCSGIDGITIGPLIGVPDSPVQQLYVAYGVYGEVLRGDNDHQVLLRYDMESLSTFFHRPSQTDMHDTGPAAPDDKLFVFTGNTCYGVQNLEYDTFTGDWMMAVYQGNKPQYPNYPLFIVDGAIQPTRGQLRGCEGEVGKLLQLKKAGRHDAASGVYGFDFPHGSTGLCALGDGYYYVSHHRTGEEGHASTVRLYAWDGAAPLRRV